jgi:hypothetical protein
MAWKSRTVVAVGALVLAHACGGDDGGVAGGTGATGSGGTAASGGSGGTGGLPIEGGIPIDEIASLAVEPPSATIQALNGSPASVQFQAVATSKTGVKSVTPAVWSFDRLDLGLIDGSGTLSAHGKKAGQGTVTAKVGQHQATASATIQLAFEENPANLSQAQKDQFGTPGPTPSVTLLYPYDQTVFARGILAPELMWSGGAAGDAYKITITDQSVQLTAYVNADPPSRWLMSQGWYDALAESSSGGAIQVSVQRLDAQGAHAPTTQSWRIAPGSLRGTIYYWAVSTGQSMKIGPGESSPTVVFDSGSADQLGSPAPAGYDGTVPPWSSGVGGKRCVACHTVSKNGERLAGIFERKGSPASPWGTVDISANPASILQISPYASQTLFVALTHDGSLAVHNDIDFTLRLADATTGAPIASALDGYTQVADPSFSGSGPAGTKLAFASNTIGSYPVEYSHADLDVVDFDPQTKTFSNRKTILDAGPDAVAFPSFSPDSKWVFYQRGDYSRAKYGTSSVGHCDLNMIDVDGQGSQIPLDNANGVGVLGADSLHLNYQPNANPIAVGGYFWIVFFSPRDYGNRMQASGNPTYDNRKQLWVAAVDVNPQPGKDPSHRAFYLRGQDLETVNMKGYWALEPCKQNGLECNEGYECCEGFCRDQGDGTFKCSPPPTNECALIGEACKSAADCCQPPGSGVECIGGFCALPGPS